MDAFISHLDHLARSQPGSLSQPCVDYLRSVIKWMTVEKNEYLLKKGDTCNKIYFLQRGLLKSFYVVDQKEKTTFFIQEMEMALSIKSIYKNEPSDEYVQALEPCELFYFSYEDLEYLCANFIEFNSVTRGLMNKNLSICREQLYDMRMLTTEQRVAGMIKARPLLIQRLSTSDLAGFFDMPQEPLRKMRDRLTKRPLIRFQLSGSLQKRRRRR